MGCNTDSRRGKVQVRRAFLRMIERAEEFEGLAVLANATTLHEVKCWVEAFGYDTFGQPGDLFPQTGIEYVSSNAVRIGTDRPEPEPNFCDQHVLAFDGERALIVTDNEPSIIQL